MYKRRPSNVWNYFVTKGDKAECRLCSKQIKKCGNTSNFLAHLKNIHNLLPNQLSVADQAVIPAITNSEENIQPTIILELHQPGSLAKSNGQKDTTSHIAKRARLSEDREEKEKQLFDWIASWLVKDMLPEEIISGDGFKKFYQEALPFYSLPSQACIAERLQCKYQNSLAHVAEKLGKVQDLALTFDIWNNNITHKNHLTLTCHFIGGSRYESLVIGDRELPNNTITSDDLRTAVMDILNRWSIVPEKISCAVTHDVPGLMESLHDILDSAKYQQCFAHTLDFMVRESIHSNADLLQLIRKFRETVHFFDEITAAQESIIRDKVVVVKVSSLDDKDIDETDWNEIYSLLERYNNQSNVITSVLVGFDGPCVSESEAKMGEEIFALLKPFHQIAIEMSSERWTPISKVIPIIGVLVKAINLILPENGCPKEFKNTLLKNIRTKFKDIEADPIISVAALLDPRFKNLDFSSEAQSIKAINKLNSIITPDGESGDDQESDTDHKDDDIWCLRRVSRASRSSEPDSNKIAVEIRNYLDHKTFNLASDPIEIWENHKQLFPSIYRLATKYLAIPASAVPAERLFTNVGSIINRKRCLLDPNHIENLLILESLPADVVFSL